MFSNFGWTVLLKNKNAQTMKDFFEKNLITSESKPKMLEKHRGKKISCEVFTDYLNRNIIERYSRNTFLGALFLAERVNRAIRHPLENLFFSKGDGNWLHLLPAITKQ